MSLDQDRKKFEERLRRILDFIEKDAPDVLIGSAFACAFKTAILLYPEVLQNIGEWMHKAARQAHGVCETCDNEIAAKLSYHPTCEHCDAKTDAEAREIDDYLNERQKPEQKGEQK